jgi:hypothetical protein
MEKKIFEKALYNSTVCALDVATLFVSNELPQNNLYLIELRDTILERQFLPEKILAKELVKVEGRMTAGPLSFQGVINFFYRNGSLSRWINISVDSLDSSYTYLLLIYSNYFVSEDKKLYHQKTGNPPFHCLGPAMPPNWKEGDRFDLSYLKRNP